MNVSSSTADRAPLSRYKYSLVPYTFPYYGRSADWYPNGVVAITTQGEVWVTEIPATLETLTLFNRLITHLVMAGAKLQKKPFNDCNAKDTHYALCQLVQGMNFVIQPLVLEDPKLGSRSPFTLLGNLKPRLRIKQCDVSVIGVAFYLHFYPYKSKLEFNEGKLVPRCDEIVRIIHSRLLVVKRLTGEETFLIHVGPQLYTTNILVNPETVKLMRKLFELYYEFREANEGVLNSRFLDAALMNTIYLHVRHKISLRPAYLCKNEDTDNHRIIHRSILSTERTIDRGDEKALAIARFLLSINDVISR